MGAGGEVLVAASAASAAGDDDGVAGLGEVVDELAGLVVVEEGADGDVEGGVFAGGAGHVGAEAVAAAIGLVLGVETEVDEGVVAEGGGHEDVAAVAAVAAGGASAGDELFSTEGHAAIAAVAGFYADFCFIDEHACFNECNGSVARGSGGVVRRSTVLRLEAISRVGFDTLRASVFRVVVVGLPLA